MPTAAQFTALTEGNGFSFCPPNVDVSVYDNWITLGGVSSGTATQAEIDDSLVNAMKLFWNTHEVSGTASSSSTGVSTSSVTDVTVVETYDDQTSDALEPKDRICLDTVRNINLDDDITGSGAASSASIRINLANSSSQGVIRMYNGSTSDIVNFVGYGVSEIAICSADTNAAGGTTTASTQIKVGSYMDGSDSDTTAPDGTQTKIRVDQVTFGGMSFRSYVRASALGDSITVTADASTLSATASASSGLISSSSSSSLSSVDFYTYT